ncbi:MAG TPA: diaminopropionate ammonia-lyase [Candidatus Dorea gallistercoris]|uniref:Diaminopropionate ammonia-lyase n=1 Tax=Candidatus Dorea gallistercoris TaxID=2838542 RepID=A0A9D1R7E1_9FIRM|nr:diaminopropionate ammonia-lyase [Candidatus Dorea gallistercoris]
MSINYVHLDHPSKDPADFSPFDLEHARTAQRFHSSFPKYQPTPLVSLPALAEKLGAASIHVKDESYRFGLDAFKVLGGSYCIGRKIGELLGIPADQLSYELLTSRETHDKTGILTFVTATDGNHGRGVAWTAQKLGHKSVVYMPKGSSVERLEHIRQAGAKAQITDMNYDDAVRFANQQAEQNGWIMLQDTAWEGYQDVPRWIMEGYLTLALEAYEQLDGLAPTHIFLQAGVGAFAGSAAGFFSSALQNRPVITVVEPDKADCLYRTARADDGTLHFVTGDMDSMMAGLCCGEPCSLGWDVLRQCADYFISMPDHVAALGMRTLGQPEGDDPRIVSGESGAASFGFVSALFMDETLRELKEQIGLNEYSHILCVSTEGATDQANYQKILRSGSGYF